MDGNRWWCSQPLCEKNTFLGPYFHLPSHFPSSSLAPLFPSALRAAPPLPLNNNIECPGEGSQEERKEGKLLLLIFLVATRPSGKNGRGEYLCSKIYHRHPGDFKWIPGTNGRGLSSQSENGKVFLSHPSVLGPQSLALALSPRAT